MKKNILKYSLILSIQTIIFFSIFAVFSHATSQNMTNNTTNNNSLNLSKSGQIIPSCEMTVPAIQGPFYKEGSPVQNKLAKGMEGERIIINGKVLNFFTCEPISGAILDFWQADSNGRYDITGFTLSGKVISDKNGNYTLDTIMPGNELTGNIVRPAHIHVKAWIPDNPGNPTLVTQLYFEGDPHMDEFVNDKLILKPVNKNGTKYANFDFGLEDYREIYKNLKQEYNLK